MVCQITESPDCRTFKMEKLGYFFNARLMTRASKARAAKGVCRHAPLDNFEMLKFYNAISSVLRVQFTLKRSPRIFGGLFSGWSFRKGKF